MGPRAQFLEGVQFVNVPPLLISMARASISRPPSTALSEVDSVKPQGSTDGDRNRTKTVGHYLLGTQSCSCIFCLLSEQCTLHAAIAVVSAFSRYYSMS
jgi:hypothetical protein